MSTMYRLLLVLFVGLVVTACDMGGSQAPTPTTVVSSGIPTGQRASNEVELAPFEAVPLRITIRASLRETQEGIEITTSETDTCVGEGPYSYRVSYRLKEGEIVGEGEGNCPSDQTGTTTSELGSNFQPGDTFTLSLIITSTRATKIERTYVLTPDQQLQEK